MTSTSKPALIGSVLISALILLVWVVMLATLSDLGHSDAAGNGIGEAFAGIEILLLWVLLGILLLVTGVAGRMPWPAAAAAVFLLPASGLAAIIALELLANHNMPPYLWPLAMPTLVPPVIVAFCFWTLLSAMRAAIPTVFAAALTWGVTLILCISIWPMQQARDRILEQEAALYAQWAADFARLPPNAPLWDWTPFLNTRDDTRVADVLHGIRKLDHRQADAETMLDRGDFPLGYLGSMDLDPTPSICEKARALLRRRVQALVPQSPGSRPYADVADQVAAALAAMKWLVGYGCSCNAESQAWESMANGYRDPNFDVVELKELREPDALGRRLLQSPDKFSMLTPQAHLRAWLKFTSDEDVHRQAIDGARKLDHRTSDAVEMLNHDEFEAATVLAYMPELDLEATEPLCTASLRVLHERFARVYRPRPDDPRSYAELLQRLGTDVPLTALKWLASHGCNADAAVSEAEDLVGAYQDSTDRSAMLVSLAQLHHHQ